MIRVFADDKQLDLAENPYIQAQLNSPYIGTQQQGSVVYPFSCPFTGNNDLILGYARLPESAVDRNKTYVGKIMDDNILILEGILKVNGTDGSYSIEIEGPPAGVPLTFWNKKLNKIDFGTHEFQMEAKDTPLFAIKITPEIKPYFGLANSTLKIFHGSNVFLTYTFPSDTGNYNYLYNTGSNRTLGELLSPVAYAFNEEENLKAEGYELVISKSGINLFVPISATGEAYKIEITALVLGEFGPFNLVKTFDFTRIRYLSPILKGLQNNVPNRDPFVLPSVYNPGFYSEENKFWSRFVNWFDGTDYAKNGIRNPTAFTIVPMVSLKYLIDHLLIYMNYTPSGSAYNNADIQALIIENTRSIDLQAENCDFPFNIYQPSFDFKNHLPDITVQEFFDELKEFLGLAISYDFLSRSCNIEFIDPILKSVVNENFSNKVGERISFESSEIKKIQLSYDNIPDEDKTHEVYLPYPADSIVESSPVEYSQIKSKISSLPTKVYSPTNPDGFIFRPNIDGGSHYQGIPGGTIILDEIRLYSYCNQPGVSPFFGQDKNTFHFRLLLYIGKAKDFVGIDIVRADYKNQNLDLSLNTASENSRYNRFLKGKIEFLESAAEAETEVVLTDAEVAAFDWRKKKYIRGVNYIVHQLLPTLPVKKGFKMKMKRAV
ncbi:hypothetical protein [Emticicia fontis]